MSFCRSSPSSAAAGSVPRLNDAVPPPTTPRSLALDDTRDTGICTLENSAIPSHSAARSSSAACVPIWNLGLDRAQTPTATSSSKPTATARRAGFILQLRSQTWAADSHGLFDYESRNVYSKVFKCNCFREVYHILRLGGDVQLLSEDQAEAVYSSDSHARPLAQLSWSNGGYNLIPNSTSPTGNGNEKLWLVVRCLKERGIGIVQGDVLKLGRYRLKVKEAVNSALDDVSNRLLSTDFGNEDDCETVASDAGVLTLDVDSLNPIRTSDYNATTNSMSTNRCESNPDRQFLSDALCMHSVVQQGTGVPTAAAICEQNIGAQTFDAPSSVSLLQTDAPHIQAIPNNIPFVESVEDKIKTKPNDDFLSRGKSYSGPRTCRICLCEADDGDEKDTNNPLVAPCECKGSMKWVHLMCLRTWMAGRLNIRNDGTTICFFWRSLECELCKKPYPAVVKVSDLSNDIMSDGGNESYDNIRPNPSTPEHPHFTCNAPLDNHNLSSEHPPLLRKPWKKSKSIEDCRTIELFEIPRPEIPYAVLEPRCQQGKGLHIVSLANNKVALLGRGHESDIRLPDISVSRLHSILRFQLPQTATAKKTTLVGSGGVGSVSVATHGCFVIDDNKSKFGTLLEIRKPFRLDPNCPPISVQVGRTVLTFTLKRRWRLMIPTCMRHPATDISVVLQHQYPSPVVSFTHSQASPVTNEFLQDAASVLLEPHDIQQEELSDEQHINANLPNTSGVLPVTNDDLHTDDLRTERLTIIGYENNSINNVAQHTSSSSSSAVAIAATSHIETSHPGPSS